VYNGGVGRSVSRVNPKSRVKIMKAGPQDTFRNVIALIGSIIVGWLFAISKAVIDLKSDSAVLKYKVFNMVEKSEPKKEPGAEKQNTPVLASPDVSKFLESIKKEMK
jgi:hypothetical protein